MAKQTAGPEIERLIALLARLPGLGHRSARKAALALIKRRTDLLEPLAAALVEAASRIVACQTCGNVDTLSPCSRASSAISRSISVPADFLFLMASDNHPDRRKAANYTLPSGERT